MTADRQDGSPRIAALVVTHNRRAQLEITLDRLRAEPIDHIVVFANAPTDGTLEWLGTQTDPRLHVIAAPVNLGGAGGFAGAMEAARNRFDPDWYLLMDDDARPEPGALARFRALLPTSWDGVAAAVRFPDGAICDMNRPLRNPFAGGGRRFRLADADYQPAAEPTPVDMATFVGLFLSRRAVATTGLPDPRLFIYGDDLIYTLRASQAGLRLGFVPAIRFEHDCATMTGPGAVYRPLWKVYYHHRNGILLYRRAAGRLAWPILALRLPRWWRAGRHYGSDQAEYRRLLRAAIRDGLAGRLDSPPEGVPTARPRSPEKP